MMFFPEFGTWGAFWSYLDDELSAAMSVAYKKAGGLGNPEAYTAGDRAPHIRFIEICREHGMPDADIMRLRLEIKKVFEGGRMPAHNSINRLIRSIPIQYNVRGTWTP